MLGSCVRARKPSKTPWILLTLAHRNRSDFCDLRLRCPSRTPEIARFPREEKAMLHCDLRVRWKVASDLRFRAAISEPKTPSFCGISGDLAPSTRKSLAIAIVRFWCAKLLTLRTLKNVKDQGSCGSHGSSQKDQCQRAHSTLSTQIIISPTLHHLLKLDFRHHLILPVFISLPSQDLCFTPLLSLSSSRFISSFDKKKTLENKQKTLRNTKEIFSQKNTKETKTPP